MGYPPSTSCGEVGKILHLILNKCIPYTNEGYFIEIGANDGKTGSFTYNLARIGWSGMNFEPVPSIFKKCCENHSNHENVKNFNVGLGSEESETEIVEAGTLSTFDKNVIESYKNVPQFSNYFNNNKKHIVKIGVFDNYLSEFNIEKIDLLVLDVEGYEEEVLLGYKSINLIKPSIFIIEIADQHPDLSKYDIMMKKYKWLRNFFKNNNYKLLVNDVVDNVYVREDIYNTLEDKFKNKIKRLVRYPQYKD